MAFLKSMREGGGEDGEDGEWEEEGVRAEHLATDHEIDEDDFEEIQVAEERKEEYE